MQSSNGSEPAMSAARMRETENEEKSSYFDTNDYLKIRQTDVESTKGTCKHDERKGRTYMRRLRLWSSAVNYSRLATTRSDINPCILAYLSAWWLSNKIAAAVVFISAVAVGIVVTNVAFIAAAVVVGSALAASCLSTIKARIDVSDSNGIGRDCSIRGLGCDRHCLKRCCCCFPARADAQK